MKFKYVYSMDPIDIWEKAERADSIIEEAVIRQMPECPRYPEVFKLVMPDPPMLREVYLCKADNNGTIYIFSDFDLKKVFRYLYLEGETND